MQLAEYVVHQKAVEEELSGALSASGRKYTRDKGHKGMSLEGERHSLPPLPPRKNAGARIVFLTRQWPVRF